MSPEPTDQRLRNLAQSITHLGAATLERQAILSGVLAAIFCFQKASELGYVDRTGAALPADYARELQLIAADLASGRRVSQRMFLATLYFNAGIHRLHLSSERLAASRKREARATKRQRHGGRHVAADPIKADADKQKHEPQGLLGGRSAHWPEALGKLELLCVDMKEDWSPGGDHAG
jgi:hypothetical protein